MAKRTIAIVLFPNAEELDFAGPWEVFGMFAKYFDQDWQVVAVAQTADPVRCAKGMLVVPDYAFDGCPASEIVIVPGGEGTLVEMENAAMLDFIRRAGQDASWVTSVCTGAFVLSRAGFLSGRHATTHWASLNDLRKEPGVTVIEERFVRDGNVITAAGVSAGIDMALYLVGQIKDAELARNVQRFIEYYPEPPYAEVPAGAAQKGPS